MLAVSAPSFADSSSLSPLRWKPENRVRLEKIIKSHAHAGNYVVFDWDYTSIYQDTQESLFRYQIDNLRFKATPSEFAIAIRQGIPKTDFAKGYENVQGESINIDKIAADLDARYQYLYENYISKADKNDKLLAKIQQTEEFKDFRGKLAFLYEAIGGSFSHDVSYPWVLYLFTGMTKAEVQTLAKDANDFSLGNKLGSYVLESSDELTGKAGKISYKYKSGLRLQSEIADLFKTLKKNGIDVYVVSASLEDVVEVFATDKSYGYGLDANHVYGMRLEMKDGKYTSIYKKGYPQTQTKGKVVAIDRFIKPRHHGKDPIIVAGDSIGDYNMLTEYKGIKGLLIMKREGKLDDVAKDVRAIVQERNTTTGLFQY